MEVPIQKQDLKVCPRCHNYGMCRVGQKPLLNEYSLRLKDPATPDASRASDIHAGGKFEVCELCMAGGGTKR